MILEEKRLYLLLYLFFEISRSDGLVEFQKTNINDNVLLLKILQSIDAVSSDAYLFDVTIKLLQSVCACMHETLHKTQKIFGEDINLLHSKYEIEHENDINLYKQIYNNTCIDLQHELFNKIRRHGLRENNYYAVTKNINYYIDVNMKAVMKRVIFASLIKKENNRIFKIERHNLFKNKLLFDDHNENRVIIIITLYPFSNKTLNEVEEREVSEKEIKGILLKDSPIDIDIINTVKMPENKENFKVVTAKKCVLYSIYLFITQSLKRNTIKSFRFLRRKGTIKIYIDSITNQDFIDFPYPCCESSILLTECSQRIFEEHDASKNFVKNKTDKTKLDSYKDIVSKIKLLVKQYSNKINNNNQHIDRPNTLLLVSKPNTNFEYEIVNNSQRIIETDHNTITPKYSDLQSLNREEIIYPINITTTILKEYIMPKKLSYLAKTSHSKTTINKASSSKIFSGVKLDPILTKIEVPSTQTYENSLNIIYNNWISNHKLAKKRTTVWPESEEKITSPMNFVFYSKWPEQYTKNVQDTLTDMTFYSIKFSTEPNEIDTLLNYKSTTFRTQSQLPSQPYTLYETKYLQEKQNKSQIILENLNKNNRLSSSLENKVIFDSNNKTYANEVENKPDNNKIGLILEILNQHVTPKENKSFKKISPLDFIKYQEKLQNVNKKSTAMDVSIIPRAKASNINKKIVFMLDKADTKPDKITNRVLLETLDKHVTFEQSTSYKQTSPFHLIKHQGNLQNVKKISTAIDISIKQNANENNFNTKTVYIPNKVNTKPDTNANSVHLETLDEHIISVKNKSYKQTSPLHLIKHHGNLHHVNKRSTAMDVSNKPTTNLSNTNKKMVYMSNKEETKHDKDAKDVLLETLNKHLKSEDNESYKQTSPLHLIKYQEQEQNLNKSSTDMDKSGKPRANVSNANKKIIYISSKVETIPQNNAKDVLLETIDDNLISEDNNSYKQTSPLHFVKYSEKLRNVNNRSTAIDFSIKPRSNARDRINKNVSLLKKVETKPEKNTNILLETLDKYVTSEQSTSHKQTSLHLMKDQGIQQNIKKRSTVINISVKENANESNVNTKIVYMPNTEETKPDKNANYVQLQTQDERIISEQNRSYTQTYTFYSIKQEGNLQKINERSTAVEISDKLSSNAGKTNKKLSHMLNKVKIKPDKNKNGILLEKMDEHLISVQNKSHKQTSPLHLNIYQENVQHVKKRSTTVEISIKPNANVSNINKTNIYMPNKVTIKLDKNTKAVILKTLDENLISNENKSYKQTSPSHYIKYRGNLQKHSKKATATSIETDVSVINFTKLPLQGIKQTKTNLFSATMLDNNTLSSQTLLSQLDPLNFIEILGKKQKIKQKVLGNASFYKSDLVNVFNNISNSSKNEPYVTPRSTFKTLNVTFSTDSTVKNFKIKSKFLPRFVSNKVTNFGNTTFSNYIDIGSRDSEKEYYRITNTQSPPKVKAVFNNKITDQNNQLKLPTFTTLFRSNINNNVTTPLVNNDKDFIHENYKFHYTIQRPMILNKYIKNKNSIWQYIVTSISEKYEKSKFNDSGLSEKPNPTKRGRVIDFHYFVVTERTMGDKTYSLGFTNKEDRKSQLPSSFITLLLPQTKDITNLSVFNEEDTVKIKVNDKSNINNKIIPITTTKVVTKLFTNKSSDNHIDFTKTTILNPQILLVPERNYSSTTSANTHKMFTRSEVMYAPYIGTTEISDQITPMIRVPQVFVSYHNTNKQSITTSNISHREIDTELKRVPSTRKEGKNKKSILLPILLNKLGMTPSLANDIMILSTKNSKIFTFLNTNKRLQIREKILLDDENNIKANASSTEPAVISSTINQHMKVKKAYQYASKINNLTEDNVASQSIKDHNQILNIKKEIYLTTSTKTITTNKKPSTKSDSEKNLYTTSSINPKIKIVMIGTESLNNFTKLIPLESLKNTTSRYDNAYARTENNSRINFLKSDMESEIRLQENKLKTNNKSKIFNLLHKDITLNHDTNPYRRHFKNTGANKNVSTITTVNSITANMQKNVDTMLQKSQNDNYVRTLHNINLKQNKQKETINNPISRNNLLFFSQTIPSQIKDSRQRITDTNSITVTEAYETIKSLNKIMEMKTLHLLHNNYQNNQVKTASTNNESYAFNKTSNTNSKYESINSYLTTPASALPLSQNNTNFIGEIDLKTDLITIIHTRKVFNKSEQHHKSESVIEKNNKQYNTSAVTKIPSTVNRFEIHKSQSTIPVLFNTTSIITYPILGKYLQNRSEAFKILNNRTVTSSISPKLQTHNGNTSITSILLNKNIDKAGNKPVIAKMKGIPKEKQPYKDNKIFDLRYIEYPSQVKQSKLYLEKHLNKYRRFNVNDITNRSDKPLLRHEVTKLTKIDLRYNNKSDDNFSENLIIKPKLNKNKNRNQIIDTAFQNLTHDKNKNYILETLTNPRKSASDMQDFNYTMLKSTTSKENIITAKMNKSVSIEKNVKKWDVFIKKSHSTTQSQLFSSKRRENKEKEILISKSSLARITDSSFNKFKRFKENDNTAKMTHLSLSSPISSFVAYDNSDTSTHSSFSQKTVNENHIMESVPLDRKSKVVQKYYTTPSSVTASMFHAFVKEIQSQFNKSDIIINTPKTTPNLIEDYKHTNSSLFIISYENTKNKIKNFNKKQHDKGNFRQSTSAFDVLKLKDQNLNKKSISSYKSNKNILDTKDISESKIPVTNKTKIHSNLLKNVKDFYNGSGFRDTHDIKVQINNNFKIKTYQKIYIKTNFKSSDMKSFKKRKTIKYNTYKPTERYLGTTRRMTFKNNFNERNKQTYKPKVTFVDTRIKNIPTTSILDKKLKFRKETVATNRFNHQVKPKTLNRKQLNENTLLNPFDKTNLYTLKKLPTSIQKKVLRRIQFPSKGKDIITVNTKDFFQRRDTSKNKYFRKPLNLHPKNQIEKPVTFKPKQYIIRPMFDQIDGFNLKDKYFRPKPLLIGNNNFYREDLQTHPRSNSLLLRQKVNYIKDTLPTPVEKRKVSNALERPSYLPPNRKPTFLRDRIDSIRNYLNNADFIETTQFPIKNYVDAETEVAGELYKDPLFYFRKSGWYDSGISDDFTSTMIPKRTRRQRKTIFFLSPSVPYRYF